jgi:predicted dehydrogenase
LIDEQSDPSNLAPKRIVLVGLGVRGRHWAETMRRSDDVEIAAYVDPDPQALARARRDFGDHPFYASLDDALGETDRVDALVLATPPTTREPHLARAFRDGLPVLAEKPLAVDLPEAARFVRMAEAASVPLMVGLNFRYLPVTQAVQRFLGPDGLGVPEFARFTYERFRDGRRPDINKYPLEMDQPMLWEQSIHHFDLFRHVYGREPISVACRTWNPSWSMYRHDANVSALFTFDGGLIVNYHGTWAGSWGDTQVTWRTDCPGGAILQRAQFGDLMVARTPFGEPEAVALPPHEIWITETVNLLAAFVAFLRGRRPLESSGRDHLSSLLMVQACIDSSRDGRVVEIDIARELTALGVGSREPRG